MVASTAFSARSGWSVSPGIRWSVSRGIGGQFVPESGGQYQRILQTGQVNNGDAGVAEIIQALECAFQVNVGRAYRRWQSISQRKRVSPVKYINQMRDAIKKRLDEGNDLSK